MEEHQLDGKPLTPFHADSEGFAQMRAEKATYEWVEEALRRAGSTSTVNFMRKRIEKLKDWLDVEDERWG